LGKDGSAPLEKIGQYAYAGSLGGGASNFCASGDNWGNVCNVHVHLPPGSRIILTADERLNAATATELQHTGQHYTS